MEGADFSNSKWDGPTFFFFFFFFSFLRNEAKCKVTDIWDTDIWDVSANKR